MKVVCYFAEGVGAHKIKCMMTEVVNAEAEKVGVDSESIEKVGISSSENYSVAMPDFFGDVPFTHNDEHVVAGKTFTIRNQSGRLIHRIMLGDFIVNGLLSTQIKTEKTQEQEFLERMALHVLSHELGHCKDHELRDSSLDLSGPPNFPEGFDLNLWHEYYYPTFLSEVAACYHGRRYSNQDQIEDQIRADQDSLKAKVEVVEEIKRVQAKGFIGDVAFHSSQIIWLYLIHFRKANFLSFSPINVLLSLAVPSSDLLEHFCFSPTIAWKVVVQ